MHTVNMIIIYS